MNEREENWPISVKVKPRVPTMKDWARTVDAYLKEKVQLDRARAQEVNRDDN